MGVKGLTTFVRRKSEEYKLLKSEMLHDTKIVIDGNGLVYHLYHGTSSSSLCTCSCTQHSRRCKNKKIDCIHGGNYREFEKKCVDFFESLNKCKIKSYVLLDGADDVADSKIETIKKRADDKIKISVSIGKGLSEAILLPIFAFEVFTQAMKKCQVPYVVCDSEADSEIVTLANELRCPVVGEDSDFFIFTIENGYVPLSSLNWCNTNRRKCRDNEEALFIDVKMYNQESLRREFNNITSEQLVTFSCLQGNDYIPRDAFNTFYQQELQFSFFINSDDKIERTLYWLSVNDPVEVRRLMLKYCLRETLQRALTMYNVVRRSKFLSYLQSLYSSRAENDPALRMQGLPDHLTKEYRTRTVPPSAVNVMVNKRHFTKPIFENELQPSCHGASLHIRQAIFGVLMAHTEPGNANLYITEHDREADKRKVSTVPCTILMNDNRERSKELILRTLGVDGRALEEAIMDKCLHLPVAATIYWVQKSNPKMFVSELHSLLLIFQHGYFETPLFSTLVEGEIGSHSEIAYSQAIQAYAQWQSCLYYTSYLNAVLNEPFPVPDITKLYQGTMVHRICTQLDYGIEHMNTVEETQKNIIEMMILKRTVIVGRQKSNSVMNVDLRVM